MLLIISPRLIYKDFRVITYFKLSNYTPVEQNKAFTDLLLKVLKNMTGRILNLAKTNILQQLY